MSEQDQLASLWQQQEVELPDTKALQTMWGQEQKKQFLFLLLDLLGVLVAPALLGLFYEQLHWFEVLWLGIVGVMAVLFTGYLIWLRRAAVFQRYASTGDYLALLEQQYQRNIKLAKSTKLLVYGMSLMFALMFMGLGYFEVLETAVLAERAWVSSLILAILLTPVWVWAHKRASLFESKLLRISHQ